MILLCLVAAVTDGDTLRCQTGENVGQYGLAPCNRNNKKGVKQNGTPRP